METTTINIDQEILDIAEEFIPKAIHIQNYMNAFNDLVSGFEDYSGNARKEMETPGTELVAQLQTLSGGYSFLANTLYEMVDEFFKLDEEYKQKIDAYNARIQAKMEQG